MSDNVFIFGAGFSRDAGIPLLGDFAQTMWDIAARGSFARSPISTEDRAIFAEVVKIRDILDGYHGRANFNDRNIEDILSILAISAHANDPTAQAHLSSFSKGIARTIELTCRMKHPGLQSDGRIYNYTENNVGYYCDFWEGMFRWATANGSVPAIITFNYDLVLERSLFHFFNGERIAANRHDIFRKNHLRLTYHDPVLPSVRYAVENCSFGSSSEERRGTGFRRTDSVDRKDEMEVEILKLHGSVNFARTSGSTLNPDTCLVYPVDDPNILPPIFNKLSNSAHAKIWEVALERLKKAKRVVIVGYSLPQTDIYMQYFLKAALGPNRDFDRLTIYDPALFSEMKNREGIRERYARCFAAQFESRIDFNPALARNNAQNPQAARYQGTTYDFICTLNRNPSSILF